MKKFNFMMLFAVILQIFSPFANVKHFDAKEVKDSSCFTYSLSANMDTVTEGYQIQFNFEYESVEPACSAEDVTGEQIIIDFSPLVNSGSDITYSIDSNIFDIEVSTSGVVTLTFKDLSMEGETLVDFGGNAVFTITAKDVDGSENITITDNVGGDVNITINDDVDTDANTNKGSFGDFVEVGDTITYQVLINGQGNDVDSFHGVDSHSAGMEYVDGSFYAQQDEVWTDMNDYFTYYYDADGNMIVDNTMPFDVPVLLTYDMVVTDQEEVYHNQFEATYNTEVPDIVGDDVWFDMDGGSWVDYTHGNIEITKVDEDGNVLAGAEFDILDSDGSVVDHVVTDESGLATSKDLPLGDYQVIETLAPDGYTLDETPYNVTITDTDEDMIFELTIENHLSVGNIEITKVDEDGNVLAGAEFDIVDSDGDIVDHVITDESGLATSIDLPLGDYQVIETVAPDGYSLDQTPHDITITENGQLVQIEIENIKTQTPDITLPEVSRYGKIEITKVDEEGNVLAGAEFDIVDSDGNVVDHVVTDESGLATSIDLPLGDYQVIEIVAPEGYSLDETPHDITINEDGQVVQIEIENIKTQTPDITLPEVSRYGKIEITKVDEEGNVLAGAEFDIVDSDGNVVDHVVTDESGLATSIDLPLGDYQVIETVAPDGYTLDETPHDVTINEDGQVVQIEIENIKTQTPDITIPEIGGGKDVESEVESETTSKVVPEIESQVESEVESETKLESSDNNLAVTGSVSILSYLTILFATLIAVRYKVSGN